MANNKNKKFLDLVPPQNLEAEKSVLGATMLDQDALIKIADELTSQDFYSEKHREIYEVMLELYEEREPIDVLSVSNKLKNKDLLKKLGGSSYLTSLVNAVPSAANVSHYAKIVREKATLRRLIQVGQKITELGYAEAEDVEKLLDRSEQKLFAISQKYLKQNFIPLQDILTETFNRIDELHKDKGKLRGIPTGFSDLDNILAGLQKSDLVVLAARPSMGKTALALDIARQVATQTKIPVGIFSLEMSKEQLVDRLLCAEAQVDLWKMRTGRIREEEFPQIGEAMGVLAETPIFIDDSPSANIMELRTKARRLQIEHKVGLLIVDYLQLMEGRTTDNRVQEVSEISRNLKAIARELDIPVLAVSQLSRAVESRTPSIPQLSDLRESGCLAGDALLMRGDNKQPITIKELTRLKNPPRVMTLTSDLKLKLSKIKKAFPSGTKTLYGITTATGRKIQASANHPFLKLNGWTRLDKLKEGDRIAVNRYVPKNQSSFSLSKNKIIILAHLIGDGCYLARQPLHYTNSDRLCLNAVAKSAVAAFKVKPRLIKQKNWYHIYLPRQDSQKPNPILGWLKSLGIYNQRAGQKIIPSLIFSLSNKQLRIFIQHLWATDGCISGEKSDWSIFYASKSRKLIEQLQHLLLRFEIIGRIRTTHKKGYKDGYILDLSGQNDQLKFLQKIGIFGQKAKLVKKALKELSKVKANTNCDTIPEEIWQYIEKLRCQKGWSTREFHAKMNWAYSGTSRHKHSVGRQHLQKINQLLKDQYLNQLSKSDIYWDQIKEIKKIGQSQVYDIEMPKTHNFVANDFIVHNSIEQDSDIVMFIYREAMYKRETDRAHIADIFIKKHRNGPTGQIELYFNENQASFKNLEKKYNV